MSLFGSLFTGVSGLTAQSQSMGMISDNVSNVNTVGYKGAAADFSTLVVRNSAAAAYAPGGVRGETNYTIDTQGLIQTSTSPTNIAIDGSGFFAVNEATDGSEPTFYTRAGNFQRDELGNLRNTAGFYLQGWALDDSEEIVDRTLQTVNVRLTNGSARATSDFTVGANLDSGQAPFAGVYAAGDLAQHHASGGAAGTEPHFERALRIYDSLGNAHNLTMAVLKEPAANRWHVEFYAETGEVEVADHPNGLVASGTLAFNGDGTYDATNTVITPVYPGGAAAGDPLGINWLDTGGADDSSITYNFGTDGGSDGLIQVATDFDVAFFEQDGTEVGEVSNVLVDEEGFVEVAFTNGQRKRLFRVPIATFSNPLALEPRSGNNYAATDASGDPNLNIPGVADTGRITPSALELANVDLADEFSKMIVTQRAYSANARIISTADEMLDELIRISG